MIRPLLVASSLCLAAAPCPGIADQPTGLHDPDNAALVYYRTWISIPADLFAKVGDQFKAESDWQPSDELKQLLRDNQGSIESFVKAASLPRCDWGVEYSAGFGALLPHLGKMRATARTLGADARAHMLAGESDLAASRIAAAFCAASQLTSDSMLISPLVAIAIHSLACTQTQVLIKSGTLTDAGKKTLLDAMARFDKPDPFGVRNAIQGERVGAAWALEHQFTGPDAGRKLMAMVSGDNPPHNDAVMKMDGDAILKELKRMDAAYDALLKAWDAPDVQQRFADLERRVEKGEFGPLTMVLLPALGNCRASNDKAVKLQNDTLAALRACQPRPAPAK